MTVNDRTFCRKGLYRVASRFHLQVLERLFRPNVFRMLRIKGRITPETSRVIDRKRHYGFNVYYSPRIHPREKKSLEREFPLHLRTNRA